MTLKIGSIEADIGLNTTDLQRGEAQATKSTTKINRQLKGIETNSKVASKGFKMPIEPGIMVSLKR